MRMTTPEYVCSAPIAQDKLIKTHPGLHGCPIDEALIRMPHLADVINPVYEPDLIVDVKVHMLMPDQYPCIPGWHCDFVPRCQGGKLQYSKAKPDRDILLWISGGPRTEFLESNFCADPEDHEELGFYVKGSGVGTFQIEEQCWYRFGQTSPHRGVASTTNTWRTFIRLAPSRVCEPQPRYNWKRHHTQVYLDSNRFSW